MGCDCGCGGTCPICSRILGRLMSEHSSIILNHPDVVYEEKPSKTKSKKRKKKK